MHTVAVSYLEWIRWVATGWFRCADRVVWLEGPSDQLGMDALMDRTPDLQVSDDQGYVIAQLKPEAMTFNRPIFSQRSVAQQWLSLAGVASFHPLSARGSRLLEADAERATVRLGEPVFEKLWMDWRDRRLEDEAHSRGLALCEAFGLASPNLAEVPTPVREILLGQKTAPKAAERREGGFEGTRAWGWASAMSVALIDPQTRDFFEKTPESAKVKLFIKSLRSDFDLRRPLLSDKDLVQLSKDIDNVVSSLGSAPVPLEVIATILHYRELALGSRELSLRSLLADLTTIAPVDPQLAALAAYAIGRSMENVAVTALLYQSNPQKFAALRPVATKEPLNVMQRAAELMEAVAPTDPTPPMDSMSVTGNQPAVLDDKAVGSANLPAVSQDPSVAGGQLQLIPSSDQPPEPVAPAKSVVSSIAAQSTGEASGATSGAPTESPGPGEVPSEESPGVGTVAVETPPDVIPSVTPPTALAAQATQSSAEKPKKTKRAGKGTQVKSAGEKSDDTLGK